MSQKSADCSTTWPWSHRVRGYHDDVGGRHHRRPGGAAGRAQQLGGVIADRFADPSASDGVLRSGWSSCWCSRWLPRCTCPSCSPRSSPPPRRPRAPRTCRASPRAPRGSSPTPTCPARTRLLGRHRPGRHSRAHAGWRPAAGRGPRGLAFVGETVTLGLSALRAVLAIPAGSASHPGRPEEQPTGLLRGIAEGMAVLRAYPQALRLVGADIMCSLV